MNRQKQFLDYWKQASQFSWKEWEEYIRKYWGAVSQVDSQVGRIIDYLESTGEAENTIILFDSLKYIFDNCKNRRESWDFFHALTEMIQITGSTIMFSIDPEDFNLKEIRILSQRLEMISENDVDAVSSI